MSVRIRPIHQAEVAWKTLQDASRAWQVATGLYTQRQADAMRTPGGFTVSWMTGPCQMVDAFCAEVTGAVVGCIQLWRRGDGVGVLEFLFVMPSHQKKGYGRRLVQEAIGAARSAGIQMMEVYAMEREPEACAFWKHLLGTPNNTGEATLLGQRLLATGWRLRTADIAV